MIKISKLADYGVVVMGALADMKNSKSDAAHTIVAATDLSTYTHLPTPTVAKVLKLLAKGGLVKSTRGAQGGYYLARDVGTISLADIVRAVDGPVMLVECAEGEGNCSIAEYCALKGRWGAVNRVVAQALANVPLTALLHPTIKPGVAPALQPPLRNAARAAVQQSA